MELSRASVSALLFGTTTPQDEGGQRCISRQKIKNAGVGLSAQTVDKTDGHGDGQPPRVLGKSTLDSDKLLSSHALAESALLRKQARKPRHHLNLTSLGLD